MATGNEAVGEQACNKCREGITTEIKSVSGKVDDLKSTTETRLNDHAKDIKDLIRVTIELAEMQKTQTQSQSTIAKTLEILTNEVMEIKLKITAQEMAVAAVPKGTPNESRKPWYEIQWVAGTFPWLIKGVFVLAALVLLVAIGQGTGAINWVKTLLKG